MLPENQTMRERAALTTRIATRAGRLLRPSERTAKAGSDSRALHDHQDQLGDGSGDGVEELLKPFDELLEGGGGGRASGHVIQGLARPCPNWLVA